MAAPIFDTTTKEKIKTILPTLALTLILPALFCQTAIAAEAAAKPEVMVSGFYGWYIKKQTDQVFPLLDPEISKYVADPTIRRLRSDYKRNALPGDADYFTKVQDYDDKDWLQHIRTPNPIALGAVTVVPVTFGSKDHVSVLVFLQRHGAGWRIIKVDDTLGYQ